MTPVATAVAAQPHSREAVLAQEAASKLAASLPAKPASEIVEDLLERLQRRRLLRDASGLNHWESYCPSYLETLVRRFQTGDPLRQIVRFIVVNHASAVEFATRITCDADLAETAVSKTYIELLKGKTTVTRFYHALKMNCRDLLRRRAREQKRFESLDGLMSAAQAARANSLGCDSDAVDDIDFPSPRLEDQDPLDILIAREEGRERSAELERAIRDVRRTRDNRRILDADWWKESALSVWEQADWDSRQGGKKATSGE
ncbi:MAG: hypothetical protein KGJ84_02055 [Elusimicrobia bacterium]|nr:hypothetical protein [Elusimicrobiota bacterium]